MDNQTVVELDGVPPREVHLAIALGVFVVGDDAHEEVSIGRGEGPNSDAVARPFFVARIDVEFAMARVETQVGCLSRKI